MKEFSKWISDHNPEGSGRYRMSLIGVVCYFVLLALYLCNCGWEDGWLWILLAAVISWDVGRYCLNRFLYVRGEEMFDDRQAVSRVLRFHAFDVDGYFRELRARLFAPILVILVCAAFCAGTVWFDGRSRISGVIFVSLTGLAGMAMVCVAYLTKKWQVSREMQGQADRVMGTLLQICDKLFYVIEFLGITVGFVVTVIFSWIVMKAVIQPEPGSSSSLACLSFFPTPVIRLSPLTVTPEPFCCASSTIVRNLCIRNFLPYDVTLTWRNRTGPALSNLIQAAITSIGTANTSSKKLAAVKSKIRFTSSWPRFRLSAS